MYTGILGGGLSALALSRFLGRPCEILEKEERVGGLCRSFSKEGFLYDLGGHILFSGDPGLRSLMESLLSGNVNHCMRANKILYKGRHVKYPFENGLSALDRDEIFECLMGYLDNDSPEPVDFESWIYNAFGRGIADKYLIPYNRKIWKVRLQDMGLEWVERVPRPPLADIVRSALGIETEGYREQLNFLYPRKGGIEAFAAAVAHEGADVRTGFHITSIRKQGTSWQVSDGSHTRLYDRLVITFPVLDALKCLEDVPAEIQHAASDLRYNSMKVVLIGIKNEALMDRSAVYIPDPSVICHRICAMGYFSAHNVPDGCSSLIAEITFPPGDRAASGDDDVLTERVAADLHRMGLIDSNEITAAAVSHVHYAYVIYDHRRRRNMALIRDFFSSLGIALLGRFAEFEYINMDEVLRRARILAERLNNDDDR